MEKAFYSKLCVAGSVKFVTDEASEDIVLSDSNKFCCNLATILARDQEVVAVNLKLLPHKCIIYIAKNDVWTPEDHQYINLVREVLTEVSKEAPMSLDKARDIEDVMKLGSTIFEYCTKKLEYRINKLKKDTSNVDELYIKCFLDYAKERNNGDITDIYDDQISMSSICCDYYKLAKKDLAIPKKFLKHIEKVGSYIGSFIDIVKYACKEKYKVPFSCIDLRLLEPVTANQLIHSWNNTIRPYFHSRQEFRDFMEKCMEDDNVRKGLARVYGGVSTELDRKEVIEVYLHAELNVLANIMDQQNKDRNFIAVSKRCCYLCDSYIEFVNVNGYNFIVSGSGSLVSGSHKKLYTKWKLPEFLKKEFMRDTLFELNMIIEREINVIVKSDSDPESGEIGGSDTDQPFSTDKWRKIIEDYDLECKKNEKEHYIQTHFANSD